MIFGPGFMRQSRYGNPDPRALRTRGDLPTSLNDTNANLFNVEHVSQARRGNRRTIRILRRCF